MLKRHLTLLAVLPLCVTPVAAVADDLSAESLSSLSSIGSSTAGVLLDSSSLSSIPEMSSTALDGPAGDSAGGLVETKRVGGSEGKRIRYTSTNERGELVPVTGAYYETRRAKGLVALAPGTRGLGDQCAPSAGSSMVGRIGKGPTVNVNYEAPMVQMLLDAGYSVVVTDYTGLGTEGLHSYLNRVDQGHALIDAARATAKPNQKVAFWGYSQGGGAAAAAAELVADYAPELNIVGTFAGAPPADPLAVLEQGSPFMLTPVAGFAAASYSESYPEFKEALYEYLTPAGEIWLEGLKTSCTVDASLKSPHPDTLFKDKMTLAQIAHSDERLGKYLELNKVGKVPVSAPIMVLTNPDDDLVPSPQARQLAADYCALGSPVEYRRVVIPGSPTQPVGAGSALTPTLRIPAGNHMIPPVLQTGNVITWLDDRFAGKPFEPVCPGEEDTYVAIEGLNSVEIATIVLGALAAVGLAGAAAAPFVMPYLAPYLPDLPAVPGVPGLPPLPALPSLPPLLR